MSEFSVDVDVCGYTTVNEVIISLSDDKVSELFDEAFEGYCVICRAADVKYDRRICCACFEEELKAHELCCSTEIEKAAGI